MGDEDDIPALVIDHGTGRCIAGFSGDEEPKVFLPSVIGRYHDECYVGSAAQVKRGMLDLKYPIQRGIVTDWDDMEKIWHFLFYEELRVTPEEHPVLFTEPAFNPKANREKMAQIIFEKFNTPALYIALQAVLSMMGGWGNGTGVVINSGEGVTDVVPIYEGRAIQHAILRLELAGCDVTKYLMKLLNERGYSFSTVAQYELVAELKEKLCYVAQDFESELTRVSDYPGLEQCYELPDGQVVTINQERFQCSEVLFRPSLLGVDEDGIPGAIHKSIMKCDVDVRRRMHYNILLHGGNTMFHGFHERMQKEMDQLVLPTVKPRIVALPERRYMTWLGGSILTCLTTFQSMWVTKEAYEELGPSCVQKMCLAHL